MSALLELSDKLKETSAALSHLERALAEHPESPALRINLASVSKRFEQLQADFHNLADRKSLDVCSYRLFKEAREGPSLRGFSGALQEFQAAFSALFDALKNGPRQRTRSAPDVIASTKFGFGYAYGGSVGVVLTLERERMLIDVGTLTDTITTFFDLARAPTRDDIREVGRRLGPAPLRSIFRWADAHASDGIGADISWRHGDEAVTLVLQRAQMQRLRDEIDATSDEEHKELTLTGILTGASVVTKRFDFQPDNAEAIHGRFKDAVSVEHEVRIPKGQYRAVVEKTTKTRYSTGEVTETWYLLKLDELP